MANKLMFNKLVKTKFEIVLEDGRELTFYPPKLKVFKKLAKYIGGEQTAESAFEILTIVLNTNKEGIKFTEDEMLDIFDSDDAFTFAEGYKDFVFGTVKVNEKN